MPGGLRTPTRVVAAVAAALMLSAPARAQEPMTWGAMQEAVQERAAAGAAERAALRIPYGQGAHRYGELSLPPGPGPHPVAVVVHGGCWLSIADLSYMREYARALTRNGWATWNLEFRRIDQEGAAWPAILEDVAAGADHLRELARHHPLDLERVVATGHSSGGHLALWLAGREQIPGDLPVGRALRGTDPLPLRGVVALAPITALEDFQRRSHRCGATIVDDFLGGGATREERRRISDPGALLPLGTPQLLVMGEVDPIVPVSHGEAYRMQAAALGEPVEVAVIPGAGHFELVAPWTGPWDEVEVRLLSFLARIGNDPGGNR